MLSLLLDVEGLRVRRGARTVLHDVRLHVARGEVCGLLGPNGAGKSTTIAAALGLLAPEAGRVRLLGEDPLTAPDALRARIGLVPEQDGLAGWMTAGDYLQYWAVLQGRSIGHGGAAVLLREVGLDAPQGMPASRYSQGMRRRLAVARALVAGPELLILDEPTNGLDPRGRRQLLGLLRELARSRGVGVLLCTHLLEDVERICDRIAVLVEGRTVAEGALRELLGRARSRRYRLRLGGPVPERGVPAGGDTRLRVLRRGRDEALVELGPGLAPETAWRVLLFAGWPIREIRAEGGRLEEFYLSLTETEVAGTLDAAARLGIAGSPTAGAAGAAGAAPEGVCHMSPALAIARREGGELLASPRGLAWLLAAAGVFSGFALLLVGSTELGLLDNAQVVYDMAGLAIALGALLAAVVGVDAVAGERERGALLPLLATAAPRHSVLLGKLGAQALAWAAMAALAVPYLWAVGSTGQNLGAAVLGLLLFGTPVALAAGAGAMALGARLRSSRAALLAALTALMLVASPLLLGPSLRQSALGRGFDAVNPFSGAVNALDAMVIDGQGLAAQGWHLALVLGWLALAYAVALRALRAPRRPGEEIAS